VKLRASFLFYIHTHTHTILDVLRILVATVQCRMIECTSVTSTRREVVCDVQKMWKDTFKTPEFVTVLLAKIIFTDFYESAATWHSRTVCLETVRANAS